MEVYLVPVGPERYELYCEVGEDPRLEEAGEPPRGVWRRLVHRFRAMLARAERDREQEDAGTAPPEPTGDETWTRRLGRAVMRWVAETIAEQRLLWHLRRQDEVTLIFPDDLAAPAALSTLRQRLKRDADRHLLWLIVDAVGFVLSGLLVLVPGPNLLAYYFGFRLVGHYFSFRGARRGLACAWHTRANHDLTELRLAIDLAPPARDERVQELGSRLCLSRLAAFFRRTVRAGT